MMMSIVGGRWCELDRLQDGEAVIDLLMANLGASVGQWLLRRWLRNGLNCANGLQWAGGLEVVSKSDFKIQLSLLVAVKLGSCLPFPLVFIDHKLAMVLLNRPFRVPEAEPRFGTLIVAVSAQKVQLFGCKLCHRYRFHAVRWRQTASGKERKIDESSCIMFSASNQVRCPIQGFFRSLTRCKIEFHCETMSTMDAHLSEETQTAESLKLAWKLPVWL